MSAELFFELGTEEIPAGFIPRALDDIRRLAISIADVATEQQRQKLELTGPPTRISFDAEGLPTKAAEGFARTNGVSVAELETIKTEKGEYLFLSKVVEGGKSADQLIEILPRVIGKIPFKKSMRWKDLDIRFVRPLHWIVATFGGEIIPFTFGDLKSGNLSRGHRFMAPEEFTVCGVEDYIAQAEKQHVIPQSEKRRQLIEEQLEVLAKQLGGKINPDNDLLEEVSFLVETPLALAGTIEARFLQLPPELLITSMREHQRYFTLIDEQGQLLPHFITVANTLVKDPAVVVAGNERVLKACW